MFPRIIFSDFDGTLTHGSSLGSIFFDVLAASKQLGAEFVIVTGRSLSWSHFLLTHTNLRAMISEGGGVLSIKQGEDEIFSDIPQVELEQIEALQEFVYKFKKYFTNLPLTADSLGRLTDRAIDLHDLNDQNMPLVMKYMQEHEINFSCSSVHLNFWKGTMSKYKAMQDFLTAYRPGIAMDECLFFGDSTNDQSVFEHMKHTVGVSNIKEFLPRMQHKPKMILQGEENDGPSGVLNFLTDLRKSRK